MSDADPAVTETPPADPPPAAPPVEPDKAPAKAEAPPAKAEAPPAPPDHWSGLDEELAAYREKKGFEDPKTVLSAYRNLEKLRGVPEDQLLRIPQEGAPEELVAEYRKKLGVPEKPDAYTVALGDGAMPDAVFEGFAKIAHEHNISDAAFAAMQAKLVEVGQASAVDPNEVFTAAIEEFTETNRAGRQQIASALQKAGVTEQEMAVAVADPNPETRAKTMLAALAKIAARQGERAPPLDTSDDPAPGMRMDPDAAKAEIAKLRADEKFMAQYNNLSRSVREPAIAKMNRLYAIAGGEKVE